MPGLAPQQVTLVGPGTAHALPRGFLELLAIGVGAALGARQVGIEVPARPRLVDRVDVRQAEAVGEFHHVAGVDVDRKVHDHAPAPVGEEALDHIHVVFQGQCHLEVPHAALLKDVSELVGWFDDGELLGIIVDVTLDEG